MNTRILSALMLLTLAAAAVDAASNEMEHGVIRVAVVGKPLGTLPTTHFHAPGKLLTQHVAETLVAYRNDLSIAPVLADSWSVSDGGRTYRLALRAEAVFHNGAPLLAEHVAANWRDLYLNPKFNWDCRPYYDGTGTIEERTTGVEIQSVTAIDERTVEFRLKKPNSLFLHRLADISCGPVVFHPDSFDANGEWDTLIGTGPYQLTSSTIGKRIELVRFANYQPRKEPRDAYGGARTAMLDKIRLQVYASTREAVDALHSGAVDYVQGISDKNRAAVLTNPELAVTTTSNVTYWTLLLQTDDPVLGNSQLRRGIAKAIDIDRIARAVSDHRSSGNASVISPQSVFYSATQSSRNEYDPLGARSLVRDSGYGGDVIAIQCSRDTYPDSCLVAEMAQSMLREVGINAEVWPMSWKSLKDDHYMSGRYQMQAFIIGGRTSPTLAFGKFIGPKATNPRFYWENDSAFASLEAAESTQSIDKLRSVYDELHTMMLEDVPQIVIMNREQHDAYRVGFNGIQPTHFGRIAFWGVTQPHAK